MEKTFKIVFDLNLDGSSRILQLEATAEIKHSVPHYLISKIGRKGQPNSSELLPDIDIKCIRSNNGGYMWVHTDSGKETNLSNAIGAAIESTQGIPQIAGNCDDPESNDDPENCDDSKNCDDPGKDGGPENEDDPENCDNPDNDDHPETNDNPVKEI